jgi:HlyD family secretion protein
MIHRSARSRVLLAVATLSAAACTRAPRSATAYPGTIEVDESDAAPLVGGRVVEIRVDEGDTVRVGDTLALLTQSNLPAQVEERRARLAAARARLADLRRGSRSAELDRAAADLAAAEAEAERTARELARAERLAKDGIIPEQEFDRARTQAEAAARGRDAARATLDLVHEGSRSDVIRGAAADVQSAEALLSGANADLRELAVLAASSGVVLGRHADPGEVVSAGTPLVTIGDVGHRWARVYLPAKLLAQLPAGAPAMVAVAGASKPPISGHLGAVNPKAEFTPRAALTEEERADLLFAARVELVDPPSTMRPGLPVTVRFSAASNP